jgi:ABC-type bacteriocin/lantibiotic exporter with double-glycine peptidase domain
VRSDVSKLLDLLCGLLKPTNGQILVDGIDINQKQNNWKTQIGYVPQEIYLLDDTIKSNIAFGIREENFDEQKFRYALKMSQLTDFIQSLPEKELTSVGDQGIRLSGGQKQRIGIARSLYFMPKILILDEPTSALDSKNESLILNDIYNLDSKITLIIISHRSNVFEKCNKIYTLKIGKLIQ